MYRWHDCPGTDRHGGKYGGSGRDYLAGAIVGYETTAGVGLAIDAPSLFTRGWWPSTVCGVFGVAAAGAKFLRWPLDKTLNALGIASLNTGGMITGGHEGATARHIIFGRAAQSGVLSLLAAERASPDRRVRLKSAGILPHFVRGTEMGILEVD